MTDTSLPPVTDAPDASLKKYAALSFKEKWQIFYKRSQYVNEKGLAKAEAENLARADFGVEALSDEEVQKLVEPGIVAKVVDNKAFQAVGLSALLHKKLDWVSAQATEKTEDVRGAVTEKITDTETLATAKVEAVRTTATEKVESAQTSVTEKIQDTRSSVVEKIQDTKGSVTEKIQDAQTATQTKVETLKSETTEKAQTSTSSFSTLAHERAHEFKEQALAKAEEVKEKLFSKVPFLHHASAPSVAENSAAPVAPNVATTSITATPSVPAPIVASEVIAPTSIEANLKSIPEEQKVESAPSVNLTLTPSVSAPGVVSEEKKETLAL